MADNLITPTLPETEIPDHPTDEIGIALATANAMLKALVGCFAGGDKNGAYVIPQISLHYAVCQILELVEKSENSLDRLNDDYDVPFSSKAEAFAKAVQP